MKYGFSLLCLLLSLESASAKFGFSFSNLLFMLHAPKKPNCDGPLKPKAFCASVCETSTSRKLKKSPFGLLRKRRLETSYTWTADSCETIPHHPWYKACLSEAVESCDLDADAAYVDSSAYSDYADETSIQGGITTVSKTSFLPYIIAASVAGTLMALYAWKKRNDDRDQKTEELMGDDSSFHGSVARRLEQGTLSEADAKVETQFVDTTGYALA
mmetsp:Transcript_33105/g.78233  ORF Transcript_33105/g.78233 Transcript_33105/m.78233 type:complete len:215 (+) Transcript_33105:219-863(+)